MITNFSQYINEHNSLPSPDAFRPNRVTLFAKGSGQPPSHWNNSPFLAGAPSVSAFGRNPRPTKKKNALSYKEFVEAVKKLNR